MKVFYLFCVVLSVTLCYLVVVQRAQAWLAKSGKPATENTTEEHKTKNQNEETGKENVETTLKENVDILKDRRFVHSPLFQGLEFLNEKLSFSVVSYNLMAEPETEIVGSGSEIGRRLNGSSTGRARTDQLPRDYKIRIQVELFYLLPDIFCLQSVTMSNRFWYNLERTLNLAGYPGARLQRRQPGSGSKSRPIADCCEAVFFRKDRFDLVTTSTFYLDDLITQQSMESLKTYRHEVRQSAESREVVVVMTLRCKVTGHKVTVASMRCVPEHKNRPDLQAAQVCAVVKKLASLNSNATDRMPTILCGNLDFQPNSGPYQILRDGFISEDTEQVFSTITSVVDSAGHRRPLSSVDLSLFGHPMSTIRSAYDTVFGAEPPNLWKKKSKTFQCSSYIWYDKAQLNLVGALDMVDSKAVIRTGIPNDIFPSGSLSLKTSFQFREEMSGTQ